MLDRLISGAGAVTDGADRFVRLIGSGSRRGFATTRPGSLLVVGLLAILAGLLVLAGIEATDPTTPVTLAPADVARARNLPDRTYATMSGSLTTAYLETYTDENDNGVQDPDEQVSAWAYWLVEPEGGAGLTVRSSRSPEEIYTVRGSAVVLGDPRFLTEDYAPFDEEIDRGGLQVDPDFVLDATAPSEVTGVPLDLAVVPRPGTRVEFSGSRTETYHLICSRDVDRDRICDAEEQDQYEFLVFDRVTRQAIRVLTIDSPDFIEATVTGLLRRDERGVDSALTDYGSDLDALDLTISDRYLLEDAAPPGSAPLAFALALAATLVAGTILIGLAGGYLVYRRRPGRLPAPATTLAPGERIALRVSGELQTPTGREHVRETPAELVRFVLGRPADPAPAADDETLPTTLLVERTGYPQGVSLGLGELSRVSSGEVMAFRGPRPAIRVAAGTGTLLMSFDTDVDRDRAIAELLDEAGLGPDGRQIRVI